MKSSIYLTIFLVAQFASVATVRAVTFTIDFGLAQSISDTVGVSRGLLVVDTAGDGFAGFGDPDTDLSDLSSFSPMTAGTLVDDDMIAAVMVVSLVDTFMGYENITTYDTDDSTWAGNLSVGQSFGLYMFRDGSANGGDPVGFYRTDMITDPGYGGNMGYIIPGAGQTSRTVTITDDISIFGGPSGNVEPIDLVANDVIIPVPEPSLVLQFLVGGAVILLKRKRSQE